MNIAKIICIIVAIVFLSSCESLRGNGDDDQTDSAESMYNEAMDNLQKKSYEGAIEGFETLEKNYPYSKWAVKAQVMSAYASYQDEEYDDALVTLERFIKLHPGNEDAEYAYYLRALSFYEQISNITRDQSYTLYAKSSLKELIARYPNGEYAKDADIKLDLVEDHLAGKELEVGRFYLKDNRYIGAINRFKTVIDKHETTSHTKEALYRLVEAYTALGVESEATKYASVLGYNYPQSKWYKKAYYLIEGKEIVNNAEIPSEKWYSLKNLKKFKKLKIKNLWK